ncbi:hypothetical protein D2E22_0199 [Bifidobacterium castoris]|uniref:Uncharacterized protein n=1 Tax=Bifidobacterium castoris TaxID=2306972 RepID=A0A430FAA3_9BIFI|nr:hypothetical protein D2E22_0199 [Bifidobacterium castoris]
MDGQVGLRMATRADRLRLTGVGDDLSAHEMRTARYAARAQVEHVDGLTVVTLPAHGGSVRHRVLAGEHDLADALFDPALRLLGEVRCMRDPCRACWTRSGSPSRFDTARDALDDLLAAIGSGADATGERRRERFTDRVREGAWMTDGTAHEPEQ